MPVSITAISDIKQIALATDMGMSRILMKPNNSYTVNMNFVFDCGPDELFIQIPGSRICIYFSEKRKHEFRRQYYNHISFERK